MAGAFVYKRLVSFHARDWSHVHQKQVLGLGFSKLAYLVGLCRRGEVERHVRGEAAPRLRDV